MSKTVKIIGTVVLVIAVIAGVTGIAYASAGYEPKEQPHGLYVQDQYVEDPGVMMTVGDVEVPFADYFHFYMMNKSYTAMFYGDNFWEQDYDGAMEMDLRNNTRDTIVEMYGWLEVAKQEGITLTDEEKQEIQDTMAQQKEELGEESFKENLESMYFTGEDMYLRITEMQKLEDKAREATQAAVEGEVGDITPDTEGMYTAKHILISFDEEAEDPAADEEATLGVATGLYDQLKAAEETEGEDAAKLFDELMLEFGEDPGVESNPDGYTFGEGEMVDEFYETAKSLKEGEISAPVRTDYGYHILMRLPLDKSYLEENEESLRQEEVEHLLQERLDRATETMEVGYGEYYDEVSPGNMR